MIMTSQRERFPRLTADMRRFKKLPQIHREPGDSGARPPPDRAEVGGSRGDEHNSWEETPSDSAAATNAASAPGDSGDFDPLAGFGSEAQGLLYPSPLFPLLNNEVASACRQIQASVEQAMGHCRRDNLWRRLFHGEHLALDKLKLTKLSFAELEELLESVQSRSVGEIDPQLVRADQLPSVVLFRLPENQLEAACVRSCVSMSPRIAKKLYWLFCKTARITFDFLAPGHGDADVAFSRLSSMLD